jgi:hypothetical protein
MRSVPLSPNRPQARFSPGEPGSYMTRLNDWLKELQHATERRVTAARPTISKANLRRDATVKVVEERRYKFIIVGPKGRFAVAMNGTIYGFKNNDVNRKEQYGNVDEFREWDWQSFYPVRKSLYDWQTNGTTAEDTTTTRKRKTGKRPVVDTVSPDMWPYTEGTSVISRSVSEQCTKLGVERTSNDRNSSGNGKNKSRNVNERRSKKQT